MNTMKNEEPWHMCEKCGFKEYPNADKKLMNGITVMYGTCPVCKQKGVTLIPRRDFRFATTNDSELWD